MYIDPVLDKIFKEIKEELEEDVTLEQVKDVYYIFFMSVKNFLEDEMLPTIKIPKFGRLIPSARKIKHRMLRTPLEKYKEILNKAYNRIINEKNKRSRK